MPQLTLTLTENERLLLCFAMGAVHGVTILANKNEDPAVPEQLAFRLINLSDVKSPAPPSPATAQPAPSGGPREAEALNTRIPSPGTALALSDRWADKANRATAESIELVLSKVERRDTASAKRLVVSWQSNGRGYLQASCWDESLFAHIANRVRQKTLFYVTRPKDKYINIVGVRA